MQLLSSSSSSIILLVFLFSLGIGIAQAHTNLRKKSAYHFPAVIAFGDSIVDSGNNNHIPTAIKCDFPPYGKDFLGGKPTGRFTNGKIITDLLVEKLGIKEFLQAYLDSNLQPNDLLTGVSFASGGSGYDPQTPELVQVLGLPEQLKMFREYIGKLKAIRGEDRAKNIISDSLYILVAGSNDLANTYFTAPSRRLIYDVPAYTDLMIKGASDFLQELRSLGARRIGVFNAPPVGCVPAQRTLEGQPKRQCIEEQNAAAMTFNTKLSSLLESINKQDPHLRVVYIDVYTPLLDLITNYGSYGFEEEALGCCGIGEVEVGGLCNAISPGTCQNASKYVFWDSFHPTQQAYTALINQLLPKYIRRLI